MVNFPPHIRPDQPETYVLRVSKTTGKIETQDNTSWHKMGNFLRKFVYSGEWSYKTSNIYRAIQSENAKNDPHLSDLEKWVDTQMVSDKTWRYIRNVYDKKFYKTHSLAIQRLGNQNLSNQPLSLPPQLPIPSVSASVAEAPANASSPDHIVHKTAMQIIQDLPIEVKSQIDAYNATLTTLYSEIRKLDETKEILFEQKKRGVDTATEIGKIRDKIADKTLQVNSLIEEKVKLIAKQNLTGPEKVVVLAMPGVIPKGKRFYHATNELKHILSILRDGITKKSSRDNLGGRFGETNLLGQGVYVASSGGYQGDGYHHALVLETVSDVPTIRIPYQSELTHKEFYKPLQLSKEDIQEGFALLEDQYAVIQKDYMPPRDGECNIRDPQHLFKAIYTAVPKENGWRHQRLPQIPINDQWKPLL